MMKIIVECQKCHNRVEIEPETRGNVAYFERELAANNFTIYNTYIDIDLQKDVVSDADDVDAALKEIRIDCDNCGEYICLSF